MSYYDQHQAPPSAYPPQSYPPPAAGYPAQPYVAPPPAGYPGKDGVAAGYPPQQAHETKDRGDGFWKGCCAALCCCCLLDACF